jgi:uncharacterized protein (DUF885 family)
MNKIIIVVLSLPLIVCSSHSSLRKYHSYIDNSFKAYAESQPVWATTNGLYDNAYRLPDILPESFEKWHIEFKNEIGYLMSIDTVGWNIDDQIDYIDDIYDRKMSILSYEETKWFRNSPDFYLDECYTGIKQLLIRNPDPSIDRLLLAYERIKIIPTFLEAARANIENSEKGRMMNMLIIARKLMGVINTACLLLTDKMPEKISEISSTRETAILSIAEFGNSLATFMREEEGDLKAVGRDYYNSMLLYGFNLDLDVDSVFSIAEFNFNRADSILKIVKTYLNADSIFTENISDSLVDNWDSIIADYNNEINFIRNYLKNEKILYVPEEALNLTIVPLPSWMSEIGIEGDYYVAPAPLDPIQPGIFYVAFPLSENTNDKSQTEYMANIRKDIVNFMLPGYHYRNFMTQRNSSIYRKIENSSMFDGWNLYIEELLIDKGFWEDNYNVVYDYYKYLRLVALSSMLEIELHANGISIDSAYSILTNKLGSDASSYGKESILGLTLYHAHYTSVLMGYYLFNNMRERAQKIEGSEFDLQEFHEKVLWEGRISPALIALKYRWN